MVRPAPGGKQNYVDPLIVASADPALSKSLGRCRDPAQAVGVDRAAKLGRASAPLDLDESHGPAPPSNQVDFAARGLYPAGENPPPF
jgi:hypothetical protein